jgi:hypothetical protein
VRVAALFSLPHLAQIRNDTCKHEVFLRCRSVAFQQIRTEHSLAYPHVSGTQS